MLKKFIIFLCIFMLLAAGASFAETIEFVPQIPQATTETVSDQEIKELQKELAELQRRLQTAQAQEKEELLKQGRVGITGWSYGRFQVLDITGTGADNGTDFLSRPLWYNLVDPGKQLKGSKVTGSADLTMLVKANPNIEVTTNLRTLNNLSLGPGKLAIRTNFGSWRSVVGTYWTAFTPLTLYYPQNRPQFESVLFAEMRDEWDYDRGVKGFQRRLEGFQGSWQLENLDYQVILSRLKSEGYHRFLWGLQGKVKLNSQISLLTNWLSLKDDLASAVSGNPIENELMGIVAKYNPWNNFSWQTEFVRSSFDDNVLAGLPPAYDQAWVHELKWQTEKMSARASLFNIGPFYSALTAQSRDYTLEDVSIIGASDWQTAMGGLVDNAVDEALPFGLATPNRKGRQVEFSLGLPNYGKLLLERWNLFEVWPVIDGTPDSTQNNQRQFKVSRFGGEIDIGRIIRVGKMIKLSGQLEQRTTKRDSSVHVEAIDLKENIWDLAFSYEFQPQWTLNVGRKLETLEDLKTEAKLSRNSLLIGLRYNLMATSYAQLSYGLVEASQNKVNTFKGLVTELKLKTEF